MGYSLAYGETDDTEGGGALAKALAIARAHGDATLELQVLYSWAAVGFL